MFNQHSKQFKPLIVWVQILKPILKEASGLLLISGNCLSITHQKHNQGYISGKGGFKLHNFVIIWDTSTKFGQLVLFETLFNLY